MFGGTKDVLSSLLILEVIAKRSFSGRTAKYIINELIIIRTMAKTTTPTPSKNKLKLCGNTKKAVAPIINDSDKPTSVATKFNFATVFSQ